MLELSVRCSNVRVGASQSIRMRSEAVEMENKGIWHQNSRLLCMLHAVMHQSVSQPYHYSDCTQHTRTIQIKSWGVRDVEECGSDVSDLFNGCWTLWAGSESILANWCDGLLLNPVQCPSHLSQNTCNVCTIHLFTYAPLYRYLEWLVWLQFV